MIDSYSDNIDFQGRLSSPNLNRLGRGWNLLGTGVELYNLKQSSKDIKVVYTYKDGRWVQNPSVIKAGEGFWVKSR